MRDLLDYRSEFPILEETTYLVSHSLGAMPRGAADRLAQFSREWAERGIRAWAEGWWETPMRVGDQVGRIIGAPPGSTVMHQNVAVAEAVVLSCFRPVDPARNRVLYERANFPSVRYLYQAQPDLEVVVCEDEQEIVERIDERTLLVPVSHVLFRAGEIQDVAPIIARAHDAGARVVLDCYQSAGIVPLDVTALGVDFAVGGSVKWLCGGPGNGWLYVRPDLAERLRDFAGDQEHHRRRHDRDADKGDHHGPVDRPDLLLDPGQREGGAHHGPRGALQHQATRPRRHGIKKRPHRGHLTAAPHHARHRHRRPLPPS